MAFVLLELGRCFDSLIFGDISTIVVVVFYDSNSG